MSAARFYVGRVSHRRFGDVEHYLRYKIAYLLIDLDRLGEANKASRLFGANAPGLLAFRSSSYGPWKSDPGDLAGWVRALARGRGVKETIERIELLTLPRMLGFAFNPVSVYFLYVGRDVAHVLYEVNNTFGERHHYFLPAQTRDTGAMRHDCTKAFHVSPFFEVAGRYTFNVIAPGDHAAMKIDYTGPDGERRLNASFSGEAVEVSTASCARLLFGLPFMTLGVVAGIHYEALKLWWKGARYHPHNKTAQLENGQRAARINNKLEKAS